MISNVTEYTGPDRRTNPKGSTEPNGRNGKTVHNGRAAKHGRSGTNGQAEKDPASGNQAGKTERAGSTQEHVENVARALWFAPDPRLKTKAAADQAIRLANWIVTGRGLEGKPDEETLFAGMHTCAYKAARKSCTEAAQEQWIQRWETIRGYIVERNLGLVYSMLGRFSSRRTDEDDLLSDAMLALTRAADRFNPWRGYRFSTYACNVIARALMRRGKRESNYRRLFPIQHDASFERAEHMADADSELYVERLRRILEQNVCDLTEMETQILAQRFPEGQKAKLTFQEIGNAVGLSKERVRQIQNVALEKLREVLTGDPVLQ